MVVWLKITVNASTKYEENEVTPGKWVIYLTSLTKLVHKKLRKCDDTLVKLSWKFL